MIQKVHIKEKTEKRSLKTLISKLKLFVVLTCKDSDRVFVLEFFFLQLAINDGF